MTPVFNQYLGKAGHLRVMSNFLVRGWNVAMPEVDIGDDVFVVKDEEGLLRRVQVKTATSRTKEKASGFTATYSLRIDQLMNLSEIPIHYVFMVWKRADNEWTRPIIIRQDALLDQVTLEKLRQTKSNNLTITLVFNSNDVLHGRRSWKNHEEDYRDFPIIDH